MLGSWILWKQFERFVQQFLLNKYSVTTITRATWTTLTNVFTTNFAREFAHGKILPMDFNFVSRFQDGRQIVIKVFYGYFL